jgi:Ala-tRNA(Pro) deacylase
MQVTEKIINHLKENQIVFQQIEHAAAGGVDEYSKTLGTDLRQQAKALFVRFKQSKSKGFVVVTMPANKRADLSLICQLMHAKEARLGTVEQLREITGCAYGELPPFGKIFSLPLLMDKELLQEEKIWFNAGSLTISIVMATADLVKLEKPLLF